jgi:hypothetical protein
MIFLVSSISIKASAIKPGSSLDGPQPMLPKGKSGNKVNATTQFDNGGLTEGNQQQFG